MVETGKIYVNKAIPLNLGEDADTVVNGGNTAAIDEYREAPVTYKGPEQVTLTR